MADAAAVMEIVVGTLWVLTILVNLIVGAIHLVLCSRARSKYPHLDGKIPAFGQTRSVVGGILMYFEFSDVKQFFAAFKPSRTRPFLEALYKPTLLRALKDQWVTRLLALLFPFAIASFYITGLCVCSLALAAIYMLTHATL